MLVQFLVKTVSLSLTLWYLFNAKFIYPSFSTMYKCWVMFSYWVVFLEAIGQWFYLQKNSYKSCYYVPIHFGATLFGLHEGLFGESADSILSGIVYSGFCDMPLAGLKVANNFINGKNFPWVAYFAPLTHIFSFSVNITKALVYQQKKEKGQLEDDNATELKKGILERKGKFICIGCCLWMWLPFMALFGNVIFCMMPVPDWAKDYREIGLEDANYYQAEMPFGPWGP